jgi:hypothetical protein
MVTTRSAVRPPSPARAELATYLRALGGLLEPAVRGYGDWLKQVKPLFELGATQRVTTAARARSLGERYGVFFDEILRRLQGITPPPAASRCHEYATAWLTALLHACASLAAAPADGHDVQYLRDCRDSIGDAHTAAVKLSALRTRLYDTLTKERVRTPTAN